MGLEQRQLLCDTVTFVAVYIRGYQIDNTAPIYFYKAVSALKIWTANCNIVSYCLLNQLILQIHKIKASLEYAIVDLKSPNVY